MKKGQITLTGLAEQDLISDPLTSMKLAGFAVPDYAINCVASVRPDRGIIRIMFFENPDDTLNQYTKFLLFKRKPDALVSYYNRANSSTPWIKIPPPTLVSTHVETRLR